MLLVTLIQRRIMIVKVIIVTISLMLQLQLRSSDNMQLEHLQYTFSNNFVVRLVVMIPLIVGCSNQILMMKKSTLKNKVLKHTTVL